MICVSIGAYISYLRFIGAVCATCCFCVHFAIIVATGVYRFSLFGQLCALSTMPTNWTSDTEVNDDWTYEKDGKLILALWIIQLLSFVCCFGVACFPLRSMPEAKTEAKTEDKTEDKTEAKTEDKVEGKTETPQE